MAKIEGFRSRPDHQYLMELRETTLSGLRLPPFDEGNFGGGPPRLEAGNFVGDLLLSKAKLRRRTADLKGNFSTIDHEIYEAGMVLSFMELPINFKAITVSALSCKELGTVITTPRAVCTNLTGLPSIV